MGKKMLCLIVVLSVGVALFAAGCNSTTSNADIQQKANQQIAAAKDLDFILITTPPYFHAHHLDTVVTAGKHVLMVEIVGAMSRCLAHDGTRFPLGRSGWLRISGTRRLVS